MCLAIVDSPPTTPCEGDCVQNTYFIVFFNHVFFLQLLPCFILNRIKQLETAGLVLCCDWCLGLG